MRMKRFVSGAVFLSMLALPLMAQAADSTQGGMPGMKMHGQGMHGQGMMQGGHDMMKTGDKIFSGKVGPWRGEARLVDMKAQMEKAKASGMKMGGMMKTHHIALSLTDPKTKSHVAEGKGQVTVTGPDNKSTTSDFMVMQGHFGTDVDLPVPGKYTFKVKLESGGTTGTAAFNYTVK